METVSTTPKTNPVETRTAAEIAMQPQFTAVQFYTLFDGLQLIRELVALFRTVQRFRGASIAWAAGDDSFERTNLELIDELGRNRVMLELFRTTRHDLLSQSEWRTLNTGLDTVVTQVAAGEHLANYEHKSELLQLIIRLIQRVASSRNYFSGGFQSDRLNEGRKFASADSDRDLIRLVFLEVLQFTETIGRLRGLATYAAVIGKVDRRLADQLEAIVVSVHQQLEQFRSHASGFQHYALKGIPSLVERQVNETKLLELTRAIKIGIINHAETPPDGQALFTMATEVIDIHLQIVYQTIDYLNAKTQHRLDCWYHGG